MPTNSELRALLAEWERDLRFRLGKTPVDPETHRLINDKLSRITAAMAEKEDGLVEVGYAQQLGPTCGGRILLFESREPPNEVHNNGRPLYRLYRGTINRHKPMPPLPERK